MDVDALIAEAKAFFDDAEPIVVPGVALGSKRVAVQFPPLEPHKYRALTVACPPSVDVVRDIRLGYGLDAVVSAYPGVCLVDGDDVSELTAQKWAAVVNVLSNPDRTSLAAAVWGRYEKEPAERAVGKASAGGRRKKPNSPAS